MRKKDKNLNQEGITTQESAAPVKHRKKRKKAPVIIALILVAIVIIFMISNALQPAVGAIVTTTQAFRGDLQESISTSGTVASEEKEVVFAPVNGILGEVHVAAGDAVKAGDVLISYNMEEMEKTLQQAALQQQKSDASYNGTMSNNSTNQAKLTEANINLDVLNQQIEDNESYLKELQDQLSKSKRDSSNNLAAESFDLGNQNSALQNELASLEKTDPEYETKAEAIQSQIQAVSAASSRNSYLQSIANSTDYVTKMENEISDVQERITNYKEYKSRMESQKSASETAVMDAYDRTQLDVDKQLAALTYQETEENYYKAKQGVTAKFDGIVTDCTAMTGATVTGGIQLLTLESSNNVKVTFSASKYDLEKLELGQNAEITISGNVYHGTISKINRMASLNASNTPMVGAQIHLEDPDDRIILGLDAKMIIYTNSAQNALLIPSEAINADKEGDFLYVVENGIAVRKPIVCGISSDIDTEILDGVTEEDQIILSAYTTVEEGMAVTAMPAQ